MAQPAHFTRDEALAAIRVALPDSGSDYDTGFRDAMESMVLALSVTSPVISAEFIDTLLDAHANNAPEPDDSPRSVVLERVRAAIRGGEQALEGDSGDAEADALVELMGAASQAAVILAEESSADSAAKFSADLQLFSLDEINDALRLAGRLRDVAGNGSSSSGSFPIQQQSYDSIRKWWNAFDDITERLSGDLNSIPLFLRERIESARDAKAHMDALASVMRNEQPVEVLSRAQLFDAAALLEQGANLALLDPAWRSQNADAIFAARDEQLLAGAKAWRGPVRTEDLALLAALDNKPRASIPDIEILTLFEDLPEGWITDEDDLSTQGFKSDHPILGGVVQAQRSPDGSQAWRVYPDNDRVREVMGVSFLPTPREAINAIREVAQKLTVAELVGSHLHRMTGFDRELEEQLVAVYGDKSGDARYYMRHDDPLIRRLKADYESASMDYHTAVSEARKVTAPQAALAKSQAHDAVLVSLDRLNTQAIQDLGVATGLGAALRAAGLRMKIAHQRQAEAGRIDFPLVDANQEPLGSVRLMRSAAMREELHRALPSAGFVALTREPLEGQEDMIPTVRLGHVLAVSADVISQQINEAVREPGEPISVSLRGGTEFYLSSAALEAVEAARAATSAPDHNRDATQELGR